MAGSLGFGFYSAPRNTIATFRSLEIEWVSVGSLNKVGPDDDILDHSHPPSTRKQDANRTSLEASMYCIGNGLGLTFTSWIWKGHRVVQLFVCLVTPCTR